LVERRAPTPAHWPVSLPMTACRRGLLTTACLADSSRSPSKSSVLDSQDMLLSSYRQRVRGRATALEDQVTLRAVVSWLDSVGQDTGIHACGRTDFARDARARARVHAPLIVRTHAQHMAQRHKYAPHNEVCVGLCVSCKSARALRTCVRARACVRFARASVRASVRACHACVPCVRARQR
jgi:hypothetical protein